jgi:glycosyltransferase involved in cell wall biosynthesis
MKERVPKVSIGLPVYNGEKYLSDGIESILAQTYDDFELIISDNGSTDATPQIGRARAAADGRVRFCREDVNRGATWNFNHVFELSRGEYFKWAAHDDLLAPTYLAKCVEVLDACPEVAWCQTRIGVVDGCGRSVENRGQHELSGAAEALAASDALGRPQLAPSPATRYGHQRFRKLLLGNTSCLDAYGLIRGASLKGTSLWKPCFGWEKVLLGQLALRGRCAEVPERLFLYRIHEDACSALASAEELTAWCDPSAAKLGRLVRFRLLRGHVDAAIHAPLGYCQQALCLLWIGAYVCQFHKWPRAWMQILRKQGIGGGTRDTLQAIRAQERRAEDAPPQGEPCPATPSHSTH